MTAVLQLIAVRPTERVRENLRVLLDRAVMTQREFADRMGKSQPWLQKILDGENQLRLDDLDDVAAIFNVPTAELIRAPNDELFELRPTEALCVRALRELPTEAWSHVAFLIQFFLRSVRERPTKRVKVRGVFGETRPTELYGASQVPAAEKLAQLQAFLSLITIELGSAAAGQIPDRPLPSARADEADGGRVAD